MTASIAPGTIAALHRDGRVSVRLKGNMWKGPFHLPRMLWYCRRLLDHDAAPAPFMLQD